jgi:hypothetical protein
MFPMPLFKAPDVPLQQSAAQRAKDIQVLTDYFEQAFKAKLGKANLMPMPYSNEQVPICCLSIESGYWQLQCNDANMDQGHLEELAREVKSFWESKK